MGVISEKQQEIINKAIELLKKYDKEDVSNFIYFFVISEDNRSEIGLEYDCCDNPECYESTLKELRKEYPECIYIYQDNRNDYDNFKQCHQCGKFLNDTLTWIESELEHHEEYDNDKESLQYSCTAFEIRVMLEAMPTIDCEITGYENAHPELIPAALKRQADFVNRVVRYAELVIKCLK